VTPASGFHNAAALVERVIPRKRVGLQDPADVPQVPRRVLAPAVGRVLEPYGRCRRVGAGAVVAHINSQTTRLGQALAVPPPQLDDVAAVAAVAAKDEYMAGEGSLASGTVVRTRLPRTTPHRPSRRIKRSTVQRATSKRSQLSCFQTLSAP
jgi:hypothetical protein